MPDTGLSNTVALALLKWIGVVYLLSVLNCQLFSNSHSPVRLVLAGVDLSEKYEDVRFDKTIR